MIKLKYAYYKFAPPSFESVIPLIKKGAIAGGVAAVALGAALCIKNKK